MRLISIFLFITGLWLSPGAVPSPQKQSVQLSIEVGFDGYFRGNAWVPVFVTISNDGPSISGQLSVRPLGSLQGSAAAFFSTPIELPTQSRKQVTLFAIVDNYPESLLVELRHQGATIADARQPLTRVQQPDVLYAVVSDTAAWGVNLDRVRPFVGNAYQVNLPLDRLPAHAGALAALDALLIVDADTGPDRLTDMQRQALADWVLGGGHLIVSGGAAWQRTTAGLADLLPVTVGGTVTVDDLSPFESYLGRRGDATLYDTPTLAATATLRPGAEALLVLPTQGGDIPLIARRRYGQGVIDYLAVDPVTEPLASWPNTIELWFTLLTSVDQRPSWSRGFGLTADSWGNAQDATKAIPLTLPAPQLICGFLAVYLILIGPLNYLLLKRVGRREFAWLTIPAMILIFSVLAYLTGIGLRGSSAMVNRLNVVQVWSDTDRAQVDGLVGLWSPFYTTYTLNAPEGYTIHPIPTGTGGLVGSGLGIEVEQDVAYTVRDVPVNIGSVRSFVTHGYLDDPPSLDTKATLHLPNPDSTEDITISGRVTNTSDLLLKDAVLLARGTSHPLGDLEPGEDNTFFLSMPGQDARGQSFGAAPVALGLDFMFNVSGYGYYGYSRAGAGTVNDIMQLSDDFRRRQVTTADELELRRRDLLLSALVRDLERTGGRGNNLYLAAWTDASPVEVTLTDAEYTVVDSTLYLFHIPVAVEAAEEPVEIGSDQMSWIVVEESIRRDLVPLTSTTYGGGVGQSYTALQPEDRVGFRFTPLPGVRPSRVTDLILHVDATTGEVFSPDVDLWNWETGEWETVSVSWRGSSVPDPARFVGPEGAVQVMLCNNASRNPIRLKRLEITLRGDL